MASNLRVDSIVPATGSSVSIGTATGGVNIPGVLTYEDVTNVDSIGIITARGGIRIGAGTTVGPVSGIVTYFGDGSQLTGINVDPSTAASSSGFLKILNASTPQIRLNNDASDGATTRAFFGIATGNNNYINGSVANDTVLSARVAGDLLIGCGSTVRMRISENGHVTKPNQPAFHAYGNNSWTQYTGADNTIKLLNTECNIGSHYKTSGSDEGKFVVPVNGTYYFYTTIYSGRTDNSQTDNSDYLAIYFYEDGNNLANKGGHHIRHYYNEGDRDSTSSMSYIRTCTAGEKFYVSITCNGTGYQVYGGHSAFGGYLIG